MDFRRADLRYAQDARGRDRSVQPSPQPGPHCSVPRVLFPFKDLYSLCTLLNIPLYRFRFCCIGETKTLFGCAGKGSMNNENGVSNWTYPNGQYYSLQKLPQAQKSVFEGQTPLVFCSDFSDCGGFGSEFVWVSCERCINKGISVKISFFVQYYSQFRSNWWNSECSVEEGMLLRKSRHKCCFCLEESFICVENKPCKTKTNKKWNELLMLKWNTPPFTHNIIILFGNVFLNNITNLLCIHMSVYVWQHKLHWMEILQVKRNLLKSHPVILEVIQSS